ncbi:MAG: outer membrane beta-barrel protein [Sphingobacteriales bacterium]
MDIKSILTTIALISFYTVQSFGQKIIDTTANVTAATALPMPGMSGPLTLNPVPIKFGGIYLSGVVSGLAQFQNNVSRGDKPLQTDISSGQIFIQKNSGLIQFFVEVGAYSQPDIGVPYLNSSHSPAAFYGVMPQGYLEIAPSDNLSFMIGKLPAFLGAEYTFSFENMNIQRGLLWDQSNSINRGVQANYTAGKVAFALSYNDGFYSNKYNWLSGSVTYAADSNNTLALIAVGSLSRTSISSTATPLYQNNEQGYNLIYTHTSGSFTIEPYLQYTEVPKAALLNTLQNASTYGAALLVKYSVPHSGFSLPVRMEYITSTGSSAQGAPSLVYGAGSKAWSATITPTYQYKRVFVRGELSYVKANNITNGLAFGPLGNDDSQSRVLIETGFIF